jgi:hypothetical protein
VIRFAPTVRICTCRQRLNVLKSRKKTILTLSGPFIALEIMTYCPDCGKTFHSESLLRIVPRFANVGYDLLVYVGMALFRRYRTVQEVRAELATRNIKLSSSEIDYLGRKFIIGLAIAHRQATPEIRGAMALNGGYILHLDATHDGDAPALMTGLDSLSQIVLANKKLPSEHSDYIIPFLQRLKADYGVPLACVRDMGSGIGKAVQEVFPGINDFICHFHFLRDIGKDYLGPAYSRLRKCLRNHATGSRLSELVRDLRQSLCEQCDPDASLANALKNNDFPEDKKHLIPLVAIYSLALWALHGKHCGDGYGFPFDRPLLAFADRLLELERRMPVLLDLLLSDDEPQERQPVFKLVAQACFVGEDPEFRQAVEELHKRCLIFDRLRTAMRIAPVGEGKGLNDEGTSSAMVTIRQGVEKFRKDIENDPELATDQLSRKMIAQIDKYGDKLFADPITVKTPNGPVVISPQRTNNILEQFFRGIRRGYRRKTGNNSMHKALQSMLADTPLVKNLDNPDYMKILLGDKQNLEELFAEQGATSLGEVQESQTYSDRVLPGFRSLVKMPVLPGQVIQSLTNNMGVAKSN